MQLPAIAPIAASISEVEETADREDVGRALSNDEHAQLAQLVERDGLQLACELLGIGREAGARALARVGSRRGTNALIRFGLRRLFR